MRALQFAGPAAEVMLGYIIVVFFLDNIKVLVKLCFLLLEVQVLDIQCKDIT
jgi:hypothetical protein